MTPILEVKDARRAYHGKAAVDGASLTLTAGRITCLLGPSGCGKSTLLRLIAGLEALDGGEIRGGGQALSRPGLHVPPERRDIGFVFQDYALFPHLTVEQNVGFGLKRLAADERRRRVAVELEEVKLAHRAGAYPQALSGGEQQRVALARALARRPAIVLLDEPFSGLDASLKAEVRTTTLTALRDAGAAALIVTHDAEEAMLMGDDLVLMEKGRILQSGSPRDCYAHPVSPAAARLLGEANMLPAIPKDGMTHTVFGTVPGAGSTVIARPEALILGAGDATAQVTAVSFTGSSTVLTLVSGGVSAVARLAPSAAPRVGETVKVSLDPAFCAVFD